jgi:hypothetical protein
MGDKKEIQKQRREEMERTCNWVGEGFGDWYCACVACDGPNQHGPTHGERSEEKECKDEKCGKEGREQLGTGDDEGGSRCKRKTKVIRRRKEGGL